MVSSFLSRASSGSANAKIFRAGMVVSGLAVVTTAAIALKDVIIARWFGRNDAIDAFFIAFLLPLFVVSQIVGSLGASVIPVFVEVRQKRGKEAAQELFSSVLVLNVLVLSGMALLLGWLAPYYLHYLGSGFSPEKLNLARQLLLALLPFMVFNGAASYMSSVLNAGERFALPALVPLITPLTVILLIMLTARQWGAFAVVAGTVVGSLLEAAGLAKALKKQGLRFSLTWHGFSAEVQSVVQQYRPMIAGSLLIGSAPVVDKAMAAMLSGGSVAALSYANKTVSAMFAVGATALGTATFPYFSKMAAEKDWSGCRHTLTRYALVVLAITVPLTLSLMAFSKPLVRLLFQHGAFTASDTELVGGVQAAYLIQVPFYTCGLLFVRFLSAARRNDVLMYGSAISLVLDVILNLAFMRYWGVAGIALSTSVMYVCAFLYLLVCSLRLLRQSENADSVRSLAANPSYLE